MGHNHDVYLRRNPLVQPIVPIALQKQTITAQLTIVRAKRSDILIRLSVFFNFAIF